MLDPHTAFAHLLTKPAKPTLDDVGQMIAKQVTYRETRGADHLPDPSPRIDITEMLQRFLDDLSGTVEDDDERIVTEACELTFDIEDGRIVVYAQDVTVESYE